MTISDVERCLNKVIVTAAVTLKGQGVPGLHVVEQSLPHARHAMCYVSMFPW